MKEMTFNISYSQELKERFKNRKTVIQNKGTSKFKKRIKKEENKEIDLPYIKPIEIKSKIREKLMNKVDQYFNLTNENIFQMNELNKTFPWNKKHKEVIIPTNVMTNIKKMIYLVDSNDFVQSYKTMTTENRKRRNLFLSPCYLVSFIATEMNSIIQVQPNAKFLICCEPIFVDYIQILIVYYLEKDANCSFGLIQEDKTKENNDMISFISLKDIREDIIKKYNQVFYINKLSNHGICFNYIDKINQEQITKQKDCIRKGFKPITYHIINTENCPVKEKLLKFLIETNQPNELITKLVQTDDIGSVIDKLSQQEFDEIKRNYENGIVIDNQIEEVVNHWIKTRNTKLFDIISFNPLIQTKEIKEIKWNLITELLVIFPNDLLTISLIGELCLTNKITLTLVINSLQKIPSIGSIALSNELMRKHIKDIDTLQIKLKEIKTQQIVTYLPPLFIQRNYSIKCIVSESVIQLFQSDPSIQCISRFCSSSLVFCSSNQLVIIIDLSHVSWKDNILSVSSYFNTNSICLLFQHNSVSSLLCFISIFSLFMKYHFPIYFSIEPSSISLLLHSLTPQSDPRDWLIDRESVFEHLLTSISFIQPFTAQFLLSHYSLSDLCTSSIHQIPCIPSSLITSLNHLVKYHL
ncbi:hypothetical protein KM1_015600 [Entamoeba histolytica HM-3:IMSS]|nr:hypothetical protein KM1_015600 [Entamoeba histolytica HM-3:IMSS]